MLCILVTPPSFQLSLGSILFISAETGPFLTCVQDWSCTETHRRRCIHRQNCSPTIFTELPVQGTSPFNVFILNFLKIHRLQLKLQSIFLPTAQYLLVERICDIFFTFMLFYSNSMVGSVNILELYRICIIHIMVTLLLASWKNQD